MYGKSQKINSETDIGSKSQDVEEHPSWSTGPCASISTPDDLQVEILEPPPKTTPSFKSTDYEVLYVSPPPIKVDKRTRILRFFLSWKKRALVIPIKKPNPQETIASLVRIPNYRTVASYFKRSNFLSKKKRKHVQSGSKRTFGILWCQITPSSRVFYKIKGKKEKTIHN